MTKEERDKLIERCAKAAVDAVNSCREDGESDLRSARDRARYAILDLKDEEPRTGAGSLD